MWALVGNKESTLPGPIHCFLKRILMFVYVCCLTVVTVSYLTSGGKQNSLDCYIH